LGKVIEIIQWPDDTTVDKTATFIACKSEFAARLKLRTYVTPPCWIGEKIAFYT